MRPHLATLVEDLRAHPRDIAFVEHVGVRALRYSAAQVAELSARFHAELQRRGVHPGDRVLIWGANSVAWVAAFYGGMLRGVIAVPLDAMGNAAFAERVLRETAPKLVVGDPALLAKLDPTAAPQLSFMEFAEHLPPPAWKPSSALDRSAILQVIFTSGTTSDPKGIVHTHGNVLASLDSIEHEIGNYGRYARLVHPLRILHTLPLSHVFGQFMGLWVPPLLRAETHFESRLEASRLARLIQRERVSVLAAVPRVLELLRSYLATLDPTLEERVGRAVGLRPWTRWWRFRRQHRLLGLKFWALVCGGAALAPELERFWNGLGFALVQGYGMTETTALVTLNHPFRAAKGSVGKPLPGREVRIAPDGELLVRGSSIAASEWRNGAPQPRRADDGWLATGDLAAERATGEILFTGRKSDVIVTGAGLNIHPTDLEGALARQPGVEEAVVVPYSTPSGPQPLAILLLARGADAAAAEGAVASANRELAEFQQIRRWVRWPELELPRTATGKLLRREVAARAGQLLGSESEASARSVDALLAAVRAETESGEAAQLSEESRFADELGLDSLGLVQLQTGLEQRLGLQEDALRWQDLRTVGDLRRALAEPARDADRATEAQVGYTRWPWSAPVRWLRAAFVEVVMRPLVWVLAAPRVERPKQADALGASSLIVSNHVTALDVPLVLYALPAPARRRVAVAMAAKLLLGWRHGRAERHSALGLLTPLAYWVLTVLFNLFPLRQGVGFGRGFAVAGEALDRGMHVLLFPEGRRSADGRLGVLQSGIGLLAQQSGAPVLPVFLQGLGEIKTGRRRWFRPGTVVIKVGSPLTLFPSEQPTAFTERLRRAMITLSSSGGDRVLEDESGQPSKPAASLAK